MQPLTNACLSLSLLSLAACDPAAPPLHQPLEGTVQNVFVSNTGTHTVEYTFHNSSPDPIAAPDVFPSCSCNNPRFSADVIPPGGDAVLTLETDLKPNGLESGTVLLEWAEGSSTHLSWSVVLDELRGLTIAPTFIRRSALRHAEACVVAFLAGGVDAGTPIEARSHTPGIDVSLLWSEIAGAGMVKGELMVRAASDQALAASGLTIDVAGTRGTVPFYETPSKPENPLDAGPVPPETAQRLLANATTLNDVEFVYLDYQVAKNGRLVEPRLCRWQRFGDAHALEEWRVPPVRAFIAANLERLEQSDPQVALDAMAQLDGWMETPPVVRKFDGFRSVRMEPKMGPDGLEFDVSLPMWPDETPIAPMFTRLCGDLPTVGRVTPAQLTNLARLDPGTSDDCVALLVGGEGSPDRGQQITVTLGEEGPIAVEDRNYSTVDGAFVLDGFVTRIEAVGGVALGAAPYPVRILASARHPMAAALPRQFSVLSARRVDPSRAPWLQDLESPPAEHALPIGRLTDEAFAFARRDESQRNNDEQAVARRASTLERRRSTSRPLLLGGGALLLLLSVLSLGWARGFRRG